jgi:23S rRNA pseudouridine955/2504/2580 synthase
MSGVMTQVVAESEAGMRLDRWFKARFPALPFSHLQKLLRSGQVRLDGKRAKGDQRVEAGQTVRVPPLKTGEQVAEEGASPVPRALNREASARRGGVAARAGDDAGFLQSITLYEDRDVFVLNKPQGLATQGGSGLTRHVDGMLPTLASERGDIPRLVHRLDRDTAGVLVIAKTRKAAAELSEAFRDRATKKIYWALVRGVPRVKQGRISNFLLKGTDEHGDQKMQVTRQGGDAEHALTYYAVVDQSAQKLAWLSLRPVTGRTHQLRVHTAEMGHPIIGDAKYFNVQNWELPGGIQNRLHLLARRIVLPLPSGGMLDVTAPLPPHMLQSWNLLGLDAKQYDPIEEAPES